MVQNGGPMWLEQF